jgi:hypothetical protein
LFRHLNHQRYYTKKSKKKEEITLLYSVRNASTGSLFDAAFAGINPPIKVSTILKIISKVALSKVSFAFNAKLPVK